MRGSGGQQGMLATDAVDISSVNTRHTSTFRHHPATEAFMLTAQPLAARHMGAPAASDGAQAATWARSGARRAGRRAVHRGATGPSARSPNAASIHV